MRIGDLVNLLIPPAASAGNSGGFPKSNLGYATPLAPSIAPPNQPSKDSDSADLISLLASRRGASGGSDPALEQQLAPQDNPFANGGSILDSFIRKRAILAYHLPAQSPNGPTIALTFDVEVAYRVIDLIPAGQSLDTQG